MRNDINKQSKRYIKSVKKQMLIPGKIRERIICALNSSVDEYIEKNQSTSIDDLIERFGDPKTIAAEYILSFDHDELTAKIRKSKLVKGTVFAVTVALILAISALLTVIVFQHK
jgi:uncharacterized membrane-anchored protein